ncbi:MAG: hypothetical protein ABFC67_10640 [Mizugakiibacter sp.]|uniref:hypothetical protein n=1 Tax=Mizugakiibacter sp. TaxID=1972610 RepID=UPI0031C21C1B|nr:hypothetical protein [Xanthomonadaceae bacterium]
MAKWRALLTEAYGRFHDVIERSQANGPGLTPYDMVKRVEAITGTFPWSWGVPSEIQESINITNAWGSRLHEWGAWNSVLEGYDKDDDKWEIVNHFVEPVAFYCMLQPSSFADRLIIVAETALHQANLRTFPNEPDHLEQDNLKPGAAFRRCDRKRQLDRLGSRWSAYKPFRQALDDVNDASYREVSRNFRNLCAHSFAPRFMFGHITRAMRSFGPRVEIVAQPDGTCVEIDHPTKKAVRYTMIQLSPLSLVSARGTNLGEYQKARQALDKFFDLVDQLCARLGEPLTPGATEP